MQRLLDLYARKLAAAGLCRPEDPLLAAMEDELVFNRQAPQATVLAQVFERMSINALLYLPLGEPYRTIVDFLAARSQAAIEPSDCETRTFLHDLPVVADFDADTIAQALKRRKSVIVKGHGVLAHGTVSAEQAFVSASSVCFSCFVKFFGDYLTLLRSGQAGPEYDAAFARAAAHLPPLREEPPELMPGPFTTRDQVEAAMEEAGLATVRYGLVDSFFGNVSYCLDEVLYISQTGSSLDELGQCIDPCPLDGSKCSGLTASSELMAHQGVVLTARAQAILHGHPRFAVILSMDCEDTHCPTRGRCHIDCSRKRQVGDIPVVPGEVGTGPRGLVNTLPKASVGRRGVIVYGHGLFATGQGDFRGAFNTLLDVENFCRREYLRRVAALKAP